MILFLFELMLMVIAPVAQIILCILHLSGRIKLSITIITLICLIAGIVLPVLASNIAMVNLPSDVKCATGLVGFALLGMFFTIAVIPASGIIFYIQAYYKRKKLNVVV
ncbi:hypothetical protein ABDD95_00895 [Mucilaginibacter sp. PAMB04274]|uniref:hypothetical protein n=1 Tax=Mucilaginibacter sp. PAMB04274 TaxID=3138568 RepID=UPI0031F63885